jgi:hypothetical protein
MKWFWQRRRQRQVAVETPPPTPASTATVQRAPTTSGRIGQPQQLTGELLPLARDYLQAAGGRVRVEDEDVLSATLPDGSLIRYTTTLAKARADDSMTLLVEGSESLATMLDDIATHSRLTALQLASTGDPIALALDRCAAPARKCGRCLVSGSTADDDAVAICEVCPLRERRLVLRWRTQDALSARVVRQEQSVAVELAYLVAARDRQGRRDEWMRHAVDTVTGQAIPILSDTALASAQPNVMTAEYERMLASARSLAERALGGPLAAIGIFLRQRSLDEYRRRVEEVATTFDRLQRESPETARAAKVGRTRELSALAEVFAVDVEAQLESACFINSPNAVVGIRPQKGHGELLLHVDMGRQHVIPPDCASCGESIQAGYVCDEGHAVCARCAAACAQCGAWRCAACGEPALATCSSCGQPIYQREVSQLGEEPAVPDGILTVHHLDALPPEMWLTAIEWLLSYQGVAVESLRTTSAHAIWQGTSKAGKALAAAIRSREPWALDEIAIRQTAAHLALEKTVATRLIISMSPATAEAHLAAQQLGVQLVDRRALASLLDGLASAHDRERERQLDETQTRADAAIRARQAMLDTVDAVEHTLTPLQRTRRAASRTASAGAAGSRSLAEARTAIERASLAWETLLADWAQSFGERPARTGSLVMLADAGRFTEMAERAEHLQSVLLDATTLLAAAPTHGESGYTTWRQAMVEECAARCEAWRWRVRAYDPAEWSDFDRAWNAKAAAKAAEATTAAGHATARADKAQAQALRAG